MSAVVLRSGLRLAGCEVRPDDSDDLLATDPVEVIVLTGPGVELKVDRRAFRNCKVRIKDGFRLTVEAMGEAVRFG